LRKKAMPLLTVLKAGYRLSHGILKDWKAAGFAVAVVEKDKIVYAKGFGYKDWEAKAPVTEHTQFAIGSCTKSFTSSLIGLLAKEGKTDIDKPGPQLPARRLIFITTK
jgi:CubicO group peptidase (beta-lactamase class C family)